MCCAPWCYGASLAKMSIKIDNLNGPGGVGKLSEKQFSQKRYKNIEYFNYDSKGAGELF
jgi:hypothetical protein